jgi:hypothetical protein
MKAPALSTASTCAVAIGNRDGITNSSPAIPFSVAKIQKITIKN